MSTESGNTSRPGAANSSADNSNPLGPDGGPIRDRSDRLAPADETQVLPQHSATQRPPVQPGPAQRHRKAAPTEHPHAAWKPLRRTTAQRVPCR